MVVVWQYTLYLSIDFLIMNEQKKNELDSNATSMYTQYGFGKKSYSVLWIGCCQ
jgi:hypothetical protein